MAARTKENDYDQAGPEMEEGEEGKCLSATMSDLEAGTESDGISDGQDVIISGQQQQQLCSS